jgi:excisionase family DNA binding protein
VNDQLLTIRDVAARLRCGRDLAYQLVASGEVPSVRIGGGRLIRVRSSLLDDYLSRCETGGENSGATRLRPRVALNGGLSDEHRRRRA